MDVAVKRLARNLVESPEPSKGDGLNSVRGWECSLAAISQTTSHMHDHHEATLWLAGVTLGRGSELEL